ncbi:MAG: hypothetical protein U0893_06560 [Chloroflexota bacterium]
MGAYRPADYRTFVATSYWPTAKAEGQLGVVLAQDGGRLWLAHSGSAAPGFAAVILTVALGRGALARLRAVPALVLLGEISYSVYLLHQILLRRTPIRPRSPSCRSGLRIRRTGR